jgi:hypothetical protein
MTTQILMRRELAGILRQWADGELSAEQVHEWASSRDMNFANDEIDMDDWEGEGPDSVAHEVLVALDMLDMNLMLVEDIPIYLEFLNTPIDHFNEGYRKWNTALESIDYKVRQQSLKEIPLYAPFCK